MSKFECSSWYVYENEFQNILVFEIRPNQLKLSIIDIEIRLIMIEDNFSIIYAYCMETQFVSDTIYEYALSTSFLICPRDS